jgi:hypothetical protein
VLGSRRAGPSSNVRNGRDGKVLFRRGCRECDCGPDRFCIKSWEILEDAFGCIPAARLASTARSRTRVPLNTGSPPQIWRSRTVAEMVVRGDFPLTGARLFVFCHPLFGVFRSRGRPSHVPSVLGDFQALLESGFSERPGEQQILNDESFQETRAQRHAPDR